MQDEDCKKDSPSITVDKVDKSEEDDDSCKKTPIMLKSNLTETTHSGSGSKRSAELLSNRRCDQEFKLQ